MKSLPGEYLHDSQITDKGISGDRKWAFVSPGHELPIAGEWTVCQSFERLTIKPMMAAWRAKGTVTGMELFTVETRFSLNSGQTVVIDGRQVTLVSANDGYWDHADAFISPLECRVAVTRGFFSQLTGESLQNVSALLCCSVPTSDLELGLLREA